MSEPIEIKYRWWAFELSLWGLAVFMLVLRVLSWFNSYCDKKKH
jgi:hypothetical protein